MVFPHHENELAIAKAVTGKPLARFWIHCEQVLAENKVGDGEKSTLPPWMNWSPKGFRPVKSVSGWCPIITGSRLHFPETGCLSRPGGR
ncbi:MAG: hypothetical protein R2875_06280 [Desulfobacterales bacterium]